MVVCLTQQSYDNFQYFLVFYEAELLETFINTYYYCNLRIGEVRYAFRQYSLQFESGTMVHMVHFQMGPSNFVTNAYAIHDTVIKRYLGKSNKICDLTKICA